MLLSFYLVANYFYFFNFVESIIGYIFLEFFVYYELYIFSAFIFIFKTNKKMSNIFILILLKFNITLFFISNSNNSNFGKIKRVFYWLMLALCISILYKNGVIVHLTNIGYAFIFFAMGGIFSDLMKNTRIIFYNDKLTY